MAYHWFLPSTWSLYITLFNARMWPLLKCSRFIETRKKTLLSIHFISRVCIMCWHLNGISIQFVKSTKIPLAYSTSISMLDWIQMLANRFPGKFNIFSSLWNFSWNQWFQKSSFRSMRRILQILHKYTWLMSIYSCNWLIHIKTVWQSQIQIPQKKSLTMSQHFSNFFTTIDSE